jgi:photosystem II stability/assembly factor-like uncharacterized protein
MVGLRVVVIVCWSALVAGCSPTAQTVTPSASPTPSVTVLPATSAPPTPNTPPSPRPRAEAGVISPSGYGWISDGTVLAWTADGGKAYTRARALPVALGTIWDVAVTEGRLYVVAPPPDSTVAYPAPQVFESGDGGSTWHRQALPAATTQYGSAKFVISAHRVVALAVTDTTSSAFSQGEWYSHAVDGTWTHHDAPSGGAASSTDGTQWLVGDAVDDTVYRTTDAGRSWRRVAVPSQYHGTWVAYSPPEAFADGSLVLSATVPNAAGDHATLITYRSVNEGDTWTLIAAPTTPGGYGGGVAASSSVAGRSVWYVSPSGPPGSSDDSSRVTRVATNGAVTSVTAETLPDQLTSLSALSDTEAIATVPGTSYCTTTLLVCGSSDTIVRTTDGGHTWHAFHPG